MKGSQHVSNAKLAKNRPISAAHLRSAGGSKNVTYTRETKPFGQDRYARGRCIKLRVWCGVGIEWALAEKSV
jgi:hypothetical protein